jgi:hypothetical protein
LQKVCGALALRALEALGLKEGVDLTDRAVVYLKRRFRDGLETV